MWYKSFGWEENPFFIKTSTELVGLDERKKELINYILSNDICFLNGPTGVGKTSLLKWVKENLKNHKVIYLDAAGIDKNFSLTTYLKKHNSFFNKLFKNNFPKNIVVLLDESQDCDEELIKALKLHWDHNHIKSIVITQINPKLTKFSESFKHRVGKRIVILGQLSKSEGYDLVKLRTGDKNPFEVTAIEAILEHSNFIPRKILEACEIVCIKNTEKKKQINAFDVESALKHPIENIFLRGLTPVWSISYKISVSVNNFFEKWFRTPYSLQKENENLKAQLINFEIFKAELSRFKNENNDLQKLLKYSPEPFQKINAQIIGIGTDTTVHSLIIDRGLKEGIFVGNPVVAAEGIIIGTILSVKDHIAIVELINDNKSHIGVAITNSDKTVGIASGSHGLNVNIEMIPQNIVIAPGDEVITSGIEESIPRGLLVGHIASVQKKSSEPFQTANLALPLDLNKISWVSVLKR